jgi:hypothetical protein
MTARFLAMYERSTDIRVSLGNQFPRRRRYMVSRDVVAVPLLTVPEQLTVIGPYQLC